MHTDVTIRRFEEKDSDDVIRLWDRCGLIVPWNHPQRDIERKLAQQREGFLVAEKEGRIVASVMAGYDGHRGWVNYLAVEPNQQRKGYGRAMMDAAEAFLSRCGAPKVNLQIRETNAEVIAFYEAIGYKNDHVVSFGKKLVQDPELSNE
jgi:ribosomal protein S18 acetylase RimI-like enzyme